MKPKKTSLHIPTPQILKYGKLKGMYLLQKYIPDLNLISDVCVINSLDEWDNIKAELPERIMFRTDNILGEKVVQIQGASGKKEDIPSVLESIKAQNENAVILIIEGKMPTYPRYKNKGGFTVSFDIGEKVVINLVGEGFDGRELTRGIATHESYTIPWNEILYIENKADLVKNNFVERKIVNEDDYKKSRKKRMEFLTDEIKENREKAEKYVPEKYSEIDEEIIKEIIDKIILKLYSQTTNLMYDNLKHFKVQGNISPNEKLITFEIFTPERIDKDQNKDYITR